MRIQQTTGAAMAAFTSAPSKGIHMGAEPADVPLVESDVQAQISRLEQQATYLVITVTEMSARLGPLLYPELVQDARNQTGIPAVPAGTPLAQVISEQVERIAAATRQLHDVQNRLGI